MKAGHGIHVDSAATPFAAIGRRLWHPEAMMIEAGGTRTTCLKDFYGDTGVAVQRQRLERHTANEDGRWHAGDAVFVQKQGFQLFQPPEVLQRGTGKWRWLMLGGSCSVGFVPKGR